jgi:type IV pilus assembly protein PilE
MHNIHSRPRQHAGFTLIELMIACAIVAILAAISVPAYQTQIAKTNRSAAKGCLAQYSQFLERHYTTSMTYADVDLTTPLPCTTEGNLTSRYTISVSGLTATAYTVVATPTTVQSAKDSRCGTMTLNEDGERGAGTNSAADIAYCW